MGEERRGGRIPHGEKCDFRLIFASNTRRYGKFNTTKLKAIINIPKDFILKHTKRLQSPKNTKTPPPTRIHRCIVAHLSVSNPWSADPMSV